MPATVRIQGFLPEASSRKEYDMSRINELFNSELHVINVGLEMFKDDILKQEGKVSHLGGNPGRR